MSGEQLRVPTQVTHIIHNEFDRWFHKLLSYLSLLIVKWPFFFLYTLQHPASCQKDTIITIDVTNLLCGLMPIFTNQYLFYGTQNNLKAADDDDKCPVTGWSIFFIFFIY